MTAPPSERRDEHNSGVPPGLDGALPCWRKRDERVDEQAESRLMRASTVVSARMRRMFGIQAAAIGVAAAAGVLLAGGQTGVPAPMHRADRSSLVMQPDREFAAASYVHRPLSPDAPRDPHSDLWVADLQRQIRDSHGLVSVNIDRYTPPLYVVGRDQPTVRVRAERSSDPAWRFEPLQRQWESVPLPDDFQPSAGTDKEAIVYQPSTARYWEFWGAEKSGRRTIDSSGKQVDEWRAAWGGQIEDLAMNPGYFPTTPQGYKFGATATGLALLAGLLTISEQRQGTIRHAIHLALPQTRRSEWVLPAQRSDGRSNDPNAIPQGATFRLPATIDLDRMDMDPYARMIARAVQTYGLVVRDSAGAVVLYAENPLGAGPDDPYFGPGGILQCPNGRAEAACYPDSNNRLRGFPWSQLQAVRMTAGE